MIKKLIVLTLCILIAACTEQNEELPAGLYSGGFMLADSELQSKVLIELKNASIPFEINSRGFVIYLQKDEAQVRGITRKVVYGDILRENALESETALNEAELDIWIKHFQKHKVPYNIKYEHGVINIYYSQIYARKVDIIAQDVGFETYVKFVEQAK